MSNPYIGQDVLDQAREAIRQGRTIDYVAGKIDCSPEHLANLLGLPQWKPIPKDDDTSVDLWAADRLDQQL